MEVRPAEALVSVASPAWPQVSEWIGSSPTPVESVVLAAGSGHDVLYRLQASAASVLGALALNTGGLLVSSRWFRLLGGGGDCPPDLASANHLPADPGTAIEAPGSLTVGYDVLGGRFAIDGGALDVAVGEVCYFGPDTLGWTGLGGGHADFVHAVLTGALEETFQDLRWDGWQVETSVLAPDVGLSLWPPPFSREGSDISSVSRRPVPLTELHGFYDDAVRQLGPPPDTN